MSGTKYNSPAKHWVEAMPLGNGSLGAMVFFGTDTERIALNHDTLWSGVPKNYPKKLRKGSAESFERAKKLVLDGEYFRAQREIEANFLDRTSEKYLPLGDIIIHFGHKNVQDYRRELVFEDAVADLSYSHKGRNFSRSCFVSHPHDALVYRISGEKRSISFELSLKSELRGKCSIVGDTLVFDGYCPGYSYSDVSNDTQYEYRDGIYTKGISFRAAVTVRVQGGKTEFSDDCIKVTRADEVCIFFTAKTNFVSPFVYPELGAKEYKNAALTVLEKIKHLSYDEIYKKHVRDFYSLYGRVKLDLGSSGKDDMPTDERLVSFAKTSDDLSLYTLLFDFARYLAISASRKGSMAMNLQGIWNDRLMPPWRSNYTVNINTEMNYWPILPSGLFECHEPLVRLIKNAAKTGRRVASECYNAKGFVIHHNIDIWGHSNAVYSKAMWGFWQGGSGWLSRHLFEEYEYTLDEKFLRNTAYPIIREAAIFYMDIMSEVEDGGLAVVPGTSPENEFFDSEGKVTAVAKYSSMMNSIAYETIRNAVSCCEILGTDEEFAKRASSVLERIVPPKVGSDGRLMEWNEEFPERDIHHRHVSHLYALHPANMITEKTPELMAAAKKTLDTRGDDGTGWSLGWKINFHARLGDGNRALKLMERQLSFVPSDVKDIQAGHLSKSGTYANLFDAHPPFQIDGNFGFASGVYEMLARALDDKLYLLPALPDKWRDGSIEGMRIKGGNTLNMVWRDGELVSYELYGKKELKVIYKGKALN